MLGFEKNKEFDSLPYANLMSGLYRPPDSHVRIREGSGNIIVAIFPVKSSIFLMV